MDKRAFLAAIVLSLLLTQSLAAAQPTPPAVATLGPVILCSAGDGGTNITIFSPQNSTAYSGTTVQLLFRVKAVGMLGQFGNVGCSLDGGVINSVTNFTNKTVEWFGPEFWNQTTVFATVALPNLSEAVHNVTVYYGWQYLASQRFEVYAYANAIFTVGTTSNPPAPSPEQTETGITASLSESASALNFGSKINFTVSVEGGRAPYTYAWYVDNQLAETSGSPYYAIPIAEVGSHHVHVEVTDSKSNSATTLTVEFNVLPAPSSSPSPSIPELPTATLAIVTLLATATFAVCIRRRKR